MVLHKISNNCDVKCASSIYHFVYLLLILISLTEVWSPFCCYSIFMQNQIFVNARKRNLCCFVNEDFTLFLMKYIYLYASSHVCILHRYSCMNANIRCVLIIFQYYFVYILLLIRIYWYFSFVAFWCFAQYFIRMKSNKNKINKLMSNDEKNLQDLD